MIDHVTEYARAVVNGEIVAGEFIILACKRHLEDLEKSKLHTFMYYFDVEEANTRIDFTEILPNPETGEPVKLLRFQKWIIGSIFGWKRKDNGNRRFKRAMISMARRNGKTFIISTMGTNELFLCETPKRNRKIVFASNALKQAKLGFEYMKDQIRSLAKGSKPMKKRVKIKDAEIKDLFSGSTAYPISSDTSTGDGFASTVAIIDEFHESKDLKMYNVLKSGQIALENSLLAIISTAGLNPNVPMYKEIQMLKRVLKKEREMDDYFIAIYEQDDVEKEAELPETWIKSNPILEHPEIGQTIMESLKLDLVAAKEQHNLNALYVKNFNVWRQASEESFISIDDWNQCGTDKVPNLEGLDVYIGLDMARSDDLAAVSFIFPLNDERQRYFVDSHSFVGTKGGLDAKISRDKIDYRGLAERGYCTITDKDTGIINQQQVLDYIKNRIKTQKLDVKGILYDPHAISLLLNELEEYPLIEVGQGAKRLSPPSKDFRLCVYDKRIVHANNPLLTIAVNNAIVKEFNDLIRIDKEKNREKIDPIVALITAHFEAMYYYSDDFDWNSYYESDDFTL
ncbi:terminase large subunit [Bacillus licheniformis]|uniref:terminase large subunit n=1 Tax=Bacillus TaxID=1386 RepID=UPI0003422F7F|nr:MULTISPECIES: terminase TerL endonuclease subunit [Bacillus subtilis group]KUL08138.1 terminase [Bacillus licheniformis LMG 7559]AGN35089.1 phage terminase like large subunit-like protein [Bacillus paralicheniformis ATCC 9945a]MCY7741848.1 terminase large subunit [Bacillus licheniformis]MDK7626437.1 terminase large subunit [Bacillus licheniformis]MEC1811013.1 terminase large subunit [Bacillus licheniformis]